MILIFGGAYQGKLNYAKANFNVDTIWDCSAGAVPNFEADCICGIEGYVMECAKSGEDPRKCFEENRDLWQELLPFLDRHAIEFYRVKGHVNLNSGAVDLQKLYDKFVEWNGSGFTFDEFRYITEKNNRADELANVGIDEIR